MILAAKGKDKESRKQLKQVSKKYFFHLLLSFFQQTWGPKMSNNMGQKLKPKRVDPLGLIF
jgi:hypothetical protein